MRVEASDPRKDLVLLVPDCNYEKGLTALLKRPQSLGIRPISFDIYIHTNRDPGCLRQAHDFLRPFASDFSYALILFDREGCGKASSRGDLEKDVAERLNNAGWRDRNTVLVIEPELDIWVWSDSPLVDSCLGWPQGQPALRTWLREQKFLSKSATKPDRPKEAMEAVLRRTKRPRSASIYAKLGQRVGVNRCADPAFQELKTTLRNWFPVTTST